MWPQLVVCLCLYLGETEDYLLPNYNLEPVFVFKTTQIRYLSNNGLKNNNFSDNYVLINKGSSKNSLLNKIHYIICTFIRSLFQYQTGHTNIIDDKGSLIR